jgi:hypothetical protein
MFVAALLEFPINALAGVIPGDEPDLRRLHRGQIKKGTMEIVPIAGTISIVPSTYQPNMPARQGGSRFRERS